MAVTIAYAVARQIADHTAARFPCEACGLLAGKAQHISAALPLQNVATAPATQFQIDPAGQLQALKAIDRAQLEWIGVYHSHPRKAPIPSETDIRECADSGLLQLIVSLEHSKPHLKLWRVEQTTVSPVELVFDTAGKSDSDRPLSPAQQAAMLIVAVAAVLILLLISFTLLPPAPQIGPMP